MSVGGLPAGGSANPMGFWIAPVSSVSEAADPALTISVYDKGSKPEAAPPHVWNTANVVRAPQSTSIKAAGVRDGEITIHISPAGVIVLANPAAWEACSEVIRLTVSQYWRFLELERTFEAYGPIVRHIHSLASKSTVKSWVQQKDLLKLDLEIRNRIQDIPLFDGLLSDPYRYLSSEREVELYWELFEELSLEGWCERIDENVEITAQTVEVVLDKLFHYKLFALSMAVEICIVGLIGTLLVH